jgi:Chaperone of endosialidase
MASTINASTSSGIVQTADTSGVLQLQTASTTALTINASQNSTFAGTVTLPINTNLYWYYNSATSYASTYADSNGFINFVTGTSSPATRMIIDSSGYVGINTTPNTYGQFAIKFDATAVGNNGTGIGIYPTAATSGAKFLSFYSEIGGGLGSITRNGTAGSVLYNTTSDYRLKTDIAPIENALSIVSQLNPVSYTWTGTEQKDTGFIAHELQAVIPSIVTGEKDAVDAKGKPVYQVVDYSKLVATLTAAIQEQTIIINDLKARITALEGAK